MLPIFEIKTTRFTIRDGDNQYNIEQARTRLFVFAILLPFFLLPRSRKQMAKWPDEEL
jgi:hypothetical protein